MPRKKATGPIITYTEILHRAISHIETEIETMQKRCEGRTDEPMVKSLLDDYIGERSPKLAALKDMYRIETGNEYC